MEFKLKEKEVDYYAGRYFLDINQRLYQLIYDNDRGYALLDVYDGTIESDFEESIEFLLSYTTITNMIPLKQTIMAEFEPTNER